MTDIRTAIIRPAASNGSMKCIDLAAINVLLQIMLVPKIVQHFVCDHSGPVCRTGAFAIRSQVEQVYLHFELSCSSCRLIINVFHIYNSHFSSAMDFIFFVDGIDVNRRKWQSFIIRILG